MAYEFDSEREDYSGAAHLGSISIPKNERRWWIHRYTTHSELSWDEYRHRWYDEATCEFVNPELVDTSNCPPVNLDHGDCFWFWRIENVFMGAFDSLSASEEDAWESAVVDIAERQSRVESFDPEDI